MTAQRRHARPMESRSDDLGGHRPPLQPWLPDQLERELNLSWSGIRPGIRTESRGRQIIVEPCEAGVIENVVKLSPELNIQVFIHLRIFQNDPVEICEAIQPDCVAPQ